MIDHEAAKEAAKDNYNYCSDFDFETLPRIIQTSLIENMERGINIYEAAKGTITNNPPTFEFKEEALNWIKLRDQEDKAYSINETPHGLFKVEEIV